MAPEHPEPDRSVCRRHRRRQRIGREPFARARRGATSAVRGDRDEAGLQQNRRPRPHIRGKAEGHVVDVSDAEQMAAFGKNHLEQFGTRTY